jgi:hypothetical protein
VSKILANSLIESYINGELDKLECKNRVKGTNKIKLIWTVPKSEFIKLVYTKDASIMGMLH